MGTKLWAGRSEVRFWGPLTGLSNGYRKRSPWRKSGHDVRLRTQNERSCTSLSPLSLHDLYRVKCNRHGKDIKTSFLVTFLCSRFVIRWVCCQDGPKRSVRLSTRELLAGVATSMSPSSVSPDHAARCGLTGEEGRHPESHTSPELISRWTTSKTSVVELQDTTTSKAENYAGLRGLLSIYITCYYVTQSVLHACWQHSNGRCSILPSFEVQAFWLILWTYYWIFTHHT